MRSIFISKEGLYVYTESLQREEDRRMPRLRKRNLSDRASCVNESREEEREKERGNSCALCVRGYVSISEKPCGGS